MSLITCFTMFFYNGYSTSGQPTPGFTNKLNPLCALIPLMHFRVYHSTIVCLLLKGSMRCHAIHHLGRGYKDFTSRNTRLNSTLTTTYQCVNFIRMNFLVCLLACLPICLQCMSTFLPYLDNRTQTIIAKCKTN